MGSFLPIEHMKKSDDLRLQCYEAVLPAHKAVILLIHGMADHASRYFKFAEYINTQGYGFVSMDLPGHGKSADSKDKLGNWPENGFAKIEAFLESYIIDLKSIYKKPIILMGHSLGSMIAIRYLCKKGEGVTSSILSGVVARPPVHLMFLGKIVSSIVGKLKGPDSKSKLLDTLSFGSYNNKFKPNRTKFDWIAKNEGAVDEYIADEHSGIICSSRYFSELVHILATTYKSINLSKIPIRMPIFLFAGSDDPVSNTGKWPINLLEILKKEGINDITLKIYEGNRHECLNEANRAAIFNDICEFCNRTLK